MDDREESRLLRLLRAQGCSEGQKPEVSFALGYAIGLIVRRHQELNPNYDGIDEQEKPNGDVWKDKSKTKTAY